MVKLIDEFRRGWQGISQPSPLFSTGFAACCVALSTLARWCLSLIRPDVFFTPYLPAVLFATAFGGARVGAATALASGTLGVALNFGDASVDFGRLALLVIFLAVCGLTIWGIEHYRTVAARQRDIAKRLIQEEEYRKLVVAELQHRLKNKLSTVHAVLHQVLHDQPAIWATIDARIRSLSATDDLIARGRRQRLRHQGSPDLRTRALRPCPIYPERRPAVSSRQIGRQPCPDIPRTRDQCRQIRRVLLRARVVAGVVVGVGRSPHHRMGRDRGSSGRTDRRSRIWHQITEFGAQAVRWQDRDCISQNRYSLHDAVPDTQKLRSAANRNN